jgi:hypothetical protein
VQELAHGIASGCDSVFQARERWPEWTSVRQQDDGKWQQQQSKSEMQNLQSETRGLPDHVSGFHPASTSSIVRRNIDIVGNPKE